MNEIKLNKNNLLYNIHLIKQISSSKICAVVKANAYGHGIKQIIAIINKDVDYFAVANLQEAVVLRKLTNKPILVLGYETNFYLAVKYDISLSLISKNQLNILAKQDINIRQNVKFHLKVNSGMNRLGEKKATILNMLNLIKESKINLQGLYTHFHNLKNKDVTKKHIKYFEKIEKIVKKHFKVITHFGGSLIINYKTKIDMIRTGIFIYGYDDLRFKPIMKVTSKIIQIQRVKKGKCVGYNNDYIAKDNIRVGVVPIGYYDGIMRNLCGLTVQVNSKPCEIIAICMDMIMIRLNKNEKINDKVVLLDGNANIWAAKLNTNTHEILTNFSVFRGNRVVE